jgi:hypothetical protein
MELTPSQKQTGFETWEHIWHLQRFMLTCQKSYILNTKKESHNLVTLLTSCTQSLVDTKDIKDQVDNIVGCYCDTASDDIDMVRSLVSNTLVLMKDILNQEVSKVRLKEYISTIFSDRCITHDQSKFSPIEVGLFDTYTPLLKTTEFGSPEYKGFLVALKPALDNHYAFNRHHPEHYSNGIAGMNLIDAIEMCCDWTASGLRTSKGSFEGSIKVTRPRFGYGTAMTKLLTNTYTTHLASIRELKSSDYNFQLRI